MKRLLAACAALAIATLPRAAAADAIDKCVDGADKAQQLRDAGKLIEAREQLIACGSPDCPGPIAKQCVKWLQEVESELPTLSLRVRDETGNDVVDVAVDADGARLFTSLDGRPFPMNPGPHELTFRRGTATAKESIMVRAGEKNRLVDVVLAPPPPPRAVVAPPPPPPVVAERRAFRFPWPAGVLFGVAVASGVATGVLVALANDDASALRRTCAPTCSSSDVDVPREKLVAANVTLGVGVASLVAAGAFLVYAALHPRRVPTIGLVPGGFGGTF